MRHPDWPKRLWVAVRDSRRETWAWGEFDCVRFAARCVDAMVIDANYCERVAAMYTDRRDAVRLVMRAGGLEPLLTDVLGVQPGPRAHARHGDLVTVDGQLGPAVGVCVMDKIVFAAAPLGITYLPLEAARYSFRID